MVRPLIADGGDLTVLRSLAAFAYGSYQVEWPESVPDDVRPEIDEDREFGYVHKMPRPVGRMGRRFVRNDASVVAADYTPEGKLIQYSGFSDVEQVLDEAVEKTGDDAFFESQIDRAGLGPLVPFVDFNVGDVWPVLIWSKLMDPQAIAEIEEVTEAGEAIGWRLHVGNTLLRDDPAVKRATDKAKRDIALERRQTQREFDNVRRTTSAISSRVDSAYVRLDGLANEIDSKQQANLEEAKKLREALAGVGAEAGDLTRQISNLNSNLRANDQDSEVGRGLIAAYIDTNTELWSLNDKQWKQQNELNRMDQEWKADQRRRDLAQDSVSAELQRVTAGLRVQQNTTQGITRDIQRRQPRFYAANSKFDTSDEYASVSMEVGELGSIYVRLKPGVSGQVVICAFKPPGIVTSPQMPVEVVQASPGQVVTMKAPLAGITSAFVVIVPD